jgi:hypothetical protein
MKGGKRGQALLESDRRSYRRGGAEVRLCKKEAFVVNVGAVGATIQGSGFRVPVSGFRVQGSGFRVQASGFRVLNFTATTPL